MDARTAEALEKSIEHWRENCTAAMNDVRLGPSSCALCQMFSNVVIRDGGEGCNECPVLARTGVPGCGETPYATVEDAYGKWCNANVNEDDATMQDAESAFRAAAREELAFLESLREKDGEDQ